MKFEINGNGNGNYLMAMEGNESINCIHAQFYWILCVLCTGLCLQLGGRKGIRPIKTEW